MKKEERAKRLMPNGIPRYIRCYDDGGVVADRYTVVFTGHYRHNTGGEFWYLGMSAYPFHPQGIGQTGYSRYQIDVPSYSHLGKKIKFEDLPEQCQIHVKNVYRYLWDIN